jgi:hypothetical protein
MCRICRGQPLSVITFNEFKTNAFRAINSYQDLSGFINQAKIIDKIRFDSSNEWGEPNILRSVSDLIFTNPNEDEGLLLFTLGCWLDMQAKYTIVWTTYLRQAKNWLHNQGPVPRARFEPTSKHIFQTRAFLSEYGNISTWFAQKINQIVEKHGTSRGNVYRLAGEICNDLYSKPDVVDSLRYGVLPKQFSGGDHKRFWMFMMFLRRDNNVMKCLFTRALNKVSGGQSAIGYWYDDQYFNPNECELPVDTWVLTNWNKMAKKLKLNNFETKYTPQVAAKARELAQKVNISPSALDAILFYS